MIKSIFMVIGCWLLAIGSRLSAIDHWPLDISCRYLRLATYNLQLYSLFAICYSLFSCQSPQETKRQQYVAEGLVLYNIHCANCHQTDGQGLADLYPPIKTEYLEDQKQLARLIRNGIKAPMTINGKTYQRPMPSNAALKDLDIAEIITFLNQEFGKNKRFLPVDSLNVWFDI